MTNYWTPTVGPDNGYGMFWHSPVASYASMGAAPSAATFGVGPAWIGGKPYWSDGSTWTEVYRTEFYSDMAAFNASGGAASYGVGPVWIGSNQFWCDGTRIVGVGRINPVGTTLAVLGDSFDVRSGYNVSAGYIYDIAGMLGIWTWTNALLRQKFLIVGGSAISGTGATSVSNPYSGRIGALLALSPEWISIRASINDLGSGATLSQIITAYSLLFDAANAAGARIITNTMGPHTSATLNTTAKRSIWAGFNRWISQVAPRYWDIVVLPQHYQYLDPAQTTGQSLNASDAHPTTPYVYRIAKAAADILAPMLSGVVSPLDAICAIGDGADAIDPNPLNAGNGGTVNAPGTGQAPAGITIVSNGTLAASVVARTDGPGQWSQIVWTPTAANVTSGINLGSRSVNSGVQVGDVCSYMFEIEIDSASTGMPQCFNCDIRFAGSNDGSGNNLIYRGVGSGSGRPPPTERGMRFVLATTPLPIPAGTTALMPQAYAVAYDTSQITMRFGQHGLVNYTKLGWPIPQLWSAAG